MEKEKIKAAGIIALVLIVVYVIITGYTNFVETDKFIKEENVKIELFNEVMPYTYFGEEYGWQGYIPEDLNITVNQVNISVAEVDGKNFVAVAYNVMEPSIQYCYYSVNLKTEKCSLVTLA